MTLMSTADLPRTALADIAAFHRSSAAPVQRSVPRPTPGVRLAVAIDRAFAALDTPDAAAAELAAGLAWTAALGETCLLTGVVADVRRGIGALRDGDLGAAAAELRTARADLPTP